MIVILLKLLFLTLFGVSSYASYGQQPTTTTVASDHSYRGIIAYPGVPASNAPTWLWMQDSTKLALHPKKIILDSLFNSPSSGNPSNILFVRSSDSALVFSLRDSLSINQSQVTGLTTSLNGKQGSLSLTNTSTSGSSTLIGNTLNIPIYTNSGGTVTSVGINSADCSVSGSPVTGSGNITVNLNTSGVSSGTYIGPYTVNSKGIITNASNPIIDTISASRAFNFGYKMSTIKFYEIRVSAQISCNLSLSGGQAGNIFLEISSDSSTWTFAGELSSSNTGTLTIGLNTTQISGGQLSTLLAPNYFWRLRTNTSTGTPTYTFQGGQKISY